MGKCEPERIIQIQVAPNDATWQGSLLGLTNAGAVYRWNGRTWEWWMQSLEQQYTAPTAPSMETDDEQ